VRFYNSGILRTKWILFATVILLSGCSKKSPIIPKLSQGQKFIIEENTNSYPENTQLSVAILNDSITNYFGVITTDDSLLIVNNKDSVFEIGSISKILTSTMLASILQDELTNLDEPIDGFLPFNLKKDTLLGGSITFRNLANHTSGFPRMPDNYTFYPESDQDSRIYTINAMQEYLENDLSLISTPGKDYNYSNLGYGLLGYLISIIFKDDYESILQDMICRPYKLKSTTTDISRIRKSLVLGKNPDGEIINNYDLGILTPSGGVFSNISDLSDFIRANFKNDILLNYQREETYGWGNFGVALGWHILKVGGQNCTWYFHSGGMEGYRSSIYLDVISKKAVIILSNLSTFHKSSYNIDQLASDLLKNEYLMDRDSAYCIAPFIELAIRNGWGAEKRDSLRLINFPKNSLHGVWTKANDVRNITRTFFPGDKVQTSFHGDDEIDVWGFYYIDKNEIILKDIGGAACVDDGTYNYQIEDGTLCFSVISDNCDGRKTGLSGDWVRVSNE
jgi:CubicO group peptidase (beta-lactamase class C family)